MSDVREPLPGGRLPPLLTRFVLDVSGDDGESGPALAVLLVPGLDGPAAELALERP